MHTHRNIVTCVLQMLRWLMKMCLRNKRFYKTCHYLLSQVMTIYQPMGVGTEEPAPGNTFVVVSMSSNNCNHFKNIQFVDNIPCIEAPDDDLVVF
jgi:hypothetical protein